MKPADLAVAVLAATGYSLGAAAVIALRYKQPDAPRPFRVPGYPLPPVLFVLAAVAIVANQVMEQPVQSAIGLGIVLFGAPAYLLWSRGGTEMPARGDQP